MLFLFEQVRTQSFGAFHSLVKFPLSDFRLIAAEQYLWHLPSLVVGRTGVDRSSEDVVLETVGEGTLLIADDSRYQSDDGVGYDSGSQFASSQYVVA